jgi:hypothetical protein
MSDRVPVTPEPDKAKQVERARRIREEIKNVKRGVPGPKTPRSFTDQAASEAARKQKPRSG